MKTSQIAAQLYTLRDFLKTPKDIIASLRKVRSIGYQTVQVSGLGPIGEEELVKILKDEGLLCCATHEDGEMILNEPQRVVNKLRKLGCLITAYPWPGKTKFDTLDDVKSFAAQLNASGKVLHDAGLVLCYHNHHMEFRHVGSRTVLEVLFAETDPRYLQAEPDTYWIQFGGGDPVDWCALLKGRLPILHLKDYAVNAKNEVVFAEVGHGNLNWHKIISTAETSGCQWFCVEQDTCPGDPFDSLKLSFDYLQANLC